ncbi:UNVERIFIED_CONTAM: hypothetical protein K2H54_009178 [Gekko kuhli]
MGPQGDWAARASWVAVTIGLQTTMTALCPGSAPARLLMGRPPVCLGLRQPQGQPRLNDRLADEGAGAAVTLEQTEARPPAFSPSPGALLCLAAHGPPRLFAPAVRQPVSTCRLASDGPRWPLLPAAAAELASARRPHGC